MGRKRVCILLPWLLVCLVGALAWILFDGLPPRLYLKYGFSPSCEPTGRTLSMEGFEFVEIGPGYFRMGSNYFARGGDWAGELCAQFGLPWGNQPKASDEMPVHWVEFPRGFWIARTEVTNEQYERFDPNHERGEFSPGDRHPVVDVSWEDAKAYCGYLSDRSGREVRLPSEAEWEASCRAGSGMDYCFGDRHDLLGAYAWIDSNSLGTAHEVATRAANAWGLFDMHGNAFEWCEDLYTWGYQDAPDDGSARVRRADNGHWGRDRVCRGGSWDYPGVNCRSANRSKYECCTRLRDLGFRVVFSQPTPQREVRPR